MPLPPTAIVAPVRRAVVTDDLGAVDLAEVPGLHPRLERLQLGRELLVARGHAGHQRRDDAGQRAVDEACRFN